MLFEQYANEWQQLVTLAQHTVTSRCRCHAGERKRGEVGGSPQRWWSATFHIRNGTVLALVFAARRGFQTYLAVGSSTPAYHFTIASPEVAVDVDVVLDVGCLHVATSPQITSPPNVFKRASR